MFTGIIEEIGTIRSMRQSGEHVRLEIGAQTVLDDLREGDSVAVNGVCLTADRLFPGGFAADVMPETLRKTSLGQLRLGSHVNLERAMAADGRFGGHMVSGHIDGTGVIAGSHQEGNAVWLRITAGPEILEQLLDRGSVAVDGVSLTVARLERDSFSLSLIPHTARRTILLEKAVGAVVNLECDMVGKYIRKFLTGALDSQPQNSQIDRAFLRKHGF